MLCVLITSQPVRIPQLVPGSDQSSSIRFISIDGVPNRMIEGGLK